MRLMHNMVPIAETPSSHRVIKISVIGGSGVGKTALVVRFLTRRFIGDYERNAGNLYSREVQVEGEQVAVQVQDTPGLEMTNSAVLLFPDHVTRSVQWADAVVLVYSVSDRSSLDLIPGLHQLVARAGGAHGPPPPVMVLANKSDLVHLRQVDPQRGHLLAAALGCGFCELSASEDRGQVHCAFQRLCGRTAERPSAPVATVTAPAANSDRRRSARPKSPNMLDLKRRLKLALSAKVRNVTSG